MASSNARYDNVDNVDNVSDTLSSSSEISEDEIDLSSCEDYCEEIGGWGKCVEPYKFQPLKSCFGVGAGVQITLSGGNLGNYLSGSFVVFIGICFGIYVSGNVSGGHINPCVTFALACCGKFPFSKVPIYVLAQNIGAFLAAGFIYFSHSDCCLMLRSHSAIMARVWDHTALRHEKWKSRITILNDLECPIIAFGSALMLICIMSVTDKNNMKPDKGVWPLLFGLIICGCALSIGYNIGNVGLNPARDLGPRLFIAIAGWPAEVFSYRNYMWFWVPTVAPMIGGPIGAWIYILLIEGHWKEEDDGNVHVESYTVRKLEIDGEKFNSEIVSTNIVSETFLKP
ncbi:Aquaporin-10 [Nymphon striatum]|nr:Aquaporin-10 [Nymphon striatum]